MLCVKSTLFLLSGLWNRTRQARALCGFQHHKGENLACFLFSDPISVGLSTAILLIVQVVRCSTSGGEKFTSVADILEKKLKVRY